MATAKLTLIGLYNYDDTLFDGLQLPAYFDKKTLVNTILLAGGEFGTLYPDPEFMKQAIALWSTKNQRFFTRLAKLMRIDYEPLENYNRQEKWTDKGSGSSESSFDNTTNGRDSSTTENKVSAFNSSEYENRDHSTTTGTDTETDRGTSSGSSEYSNDREGYARGNIGVMSSQDMYLQELSVLGINPYDVIAGDFINEFCIKIYV